MSVNAIWPSDRYGDALSNPGLIDVAAETDIHIRSND